MPVAEVVGYRHTRKAARAGDFGWVSNRGLPPYTPCKGKGERSSFNPLDDCGLSEDVSKGRDK